MKLFDIARGTVTVEIRGAEPERVLNVMAQKGIAFWDTSPNTDFCIVATVYASDYPKVQEQNGRAGCEVRMLTSSGGRRLLRSAKRRIALLAGLCVCTVALAVSSLFVWSISVTGNEKLSDAELLRALEEAGLSYGTFWVGLDTDTIKSKLLLENEELSWVGINISNSHAELCVHERVEKPELVSEGAPQSIYAAKSGVITKLCVLEGSPAVAPGDTVTQGELLVSGEMLSETAETRYVKAMAQAEARTWYELTAVTPLYEYKKTGEDGSHREISLMLGKNRINFYSDSRNLDASCDKINKIKNLSIGSAFVLPLGIIEGSTVCRETECRRIDSDEAAERMKQRLIEELQAQIGDGEIVSYTCSVSESDELLYLTLRAECLENIAISGEI